MSDYSSTKKIESGPVTQNELQKSPKMVHKQLREAKRKLREQAAQIESLQHSLTNTRQSTSFRLGHRIVRILKLPLKPLDIFRGDVKEKRHKALADELLPQPDEVSRLTLKESTGDSPGRLKKPDTKANREYLQNQSNHVFKTVYSRDLMAKLREQGTFYNGMSAVEKALSDIRIHGPRYLSMVDLLEATNLGGGPLDILEVGCNTGFLSRFIKDRHPEFNVVAVDISERSIEANKLIETRYENRVEFVKLDGDSVSQNFGRQAFDAVFLCEILEHLEHDSKLQHEILRESLASVRDSGIVVITVPYEDRIPSPGHLTEFNRGMIRDLLESEAEYVEDLDAVRKHFGMDKHFIFLAAHRPIPTIRFDSN